MRMFILCLNSKRRPRPIGRTGTELREMLPLWNGADGETSPDRSVGWDTWNPADHTGTESQESLPLWNGADGETSPDRPVGWDTWNLAGHNGTESQESLPMLGFYIRIMPESPDIGKYHQTSGKTEKEGCRKVPVSLFSVSV